MSKTLQAAAQADFYDLLQLVYAVAEPGFYVSKSGSIRHASKHAPGATSNPCPLCAALNGLDSVKGALFPAGQLIRIEEYEFGDFRFGGSSVLRESANDCPGWKEFIEVADHPVDYFTYQGQEDLAEKRRLMEQVLCGT